MTLFILKQLNAHFIQTHAHNYLRIYMFFNFPQQIRPTFRLFLRKTTPKNKKIAKSRSHLTRFSRPCCNFFSAV